MPSGRLDAFDERLHGCAPRSARKQGEFRRSALLPPEIGRLRRDDTAEHVRRENPVKPIVRNGDDRSSLAQLGHSRLNVGLYRAGRRTALLNLRTCSGPGIASDFQHPLLAGPCSG